MDIGHSTVDKDRILGVHLKKILVCVFYLNKSVVVSILLLLGLLLPTQIKKGRKEKHSDSQLPSQQLWVRFSDLTLVR